MTLTCKGIVFLSGIIILSLIFQLWFLREATGKVKVEGFSNSDSNSETTHIPITIVYHPTIKAAMDAYDNIPETDKQIIDIGINELDMGMNTSVPDTQETLPNNLKNAILALSRIPVSDKTIMITALTAIDKSSNNTSTEPIIQNIISIFDQVTTKDMQTIQLGISSAITAVVGTGGIDNPTTPTDAPDSTYTNIQSALKALRQIETDQKLLSQLIGIVFTAGMFSLTNDGEVPNIIPETIPTSSRIFKTTRITPLSPTTTLSPTITLPPTITLSPTTTLSPSTTLSPTPTLPRNPTLSPTITLPPALPPYIPLSTNTRPPTLYNSNPKHTLPAVIPIVLNPFQRKVVPILHINPSNVAPPNACTASASKPPLRRPVVPITRMFPSNIPASAHSNFPASSPSRI